MPSESNHDCLFSDDELRQFAPAPRVDKREKKKARQQERNGGGDKAGGATFQVRTAFWGMKYISGHHKYMYKVN